MPKGDRSSHVGKTISERSAYQRYIRAQPSQSTIEEATNIEPSYEAKQELTEPKSKKTREIPVSWQIGKHFEKNWISWVILILAGVAVFLLNDARADITILNNNLANQQKLVEDIQNSSQNNVEKNHSQDLLIQEIRIRLDLLIDQLRVSPTQTIQPTATPIQVIPTSTP